ncbi:hypothetical protein ACKKBF_B03165 [Auxenochlorella protothecoides x Auxenochlorella symbiontica]
MGNAASATTAAALDALASVTGPASLQLDDETWQPLLTVSTPLSRWSEDELQATIRPYCGDLVYHNCQTYNLQRLIVLTCRQLEGASKRGADMAVANLLCLLRILLQDLMEHLTPAQLQAFLSWPAPGSPHKVAVERDAQEEEQTPVEQQLVGACLRALVARNDPAASAGEYLTQLHLLQLLLVMLSTQLYCQDLDEQGLELPLLAAVLEQSEVDPVSVVETLLRLVIVGPQAPLGLRLFLPTDTRAVLRAVRAAASSLVWLPMSAFSFLLRRQPAAPGQSPLGLHACLLLLTLCFHALPGEGAEGALAVRTPGPYRLALHGLRDADDAEATAAAAEDGRGALGRGPRASFPALFASLTREPVAPPETALLLYLVLHDGGDFRGYCLARTDPEALLLPLLGALQREDAGRGDRGAVYVLLTLLLALSSDAGWAAALHRVWLEATPLWLKGRARAKQPLGSLALSVLLRSAHASVARHGDAFLQTNTLAVLANLAPHVTGLTSEAAQRLVSLLALLARRWRRLAADATGLGTMAAAVGDPATAADGTPEATSLAVSESTSAAAAESAQLAHDFLRMALESASAVLERALPANPALVYALLHRGELFEGLPRDDPGLRVPLANILAVIDHFTRALARSLGEGAAALDAGTVMAAIRHDSRAWRGDRLQRGADLHFAYEEGLQAHSFFVPCVWARVVAASSLSWDLDAISLFTPEGAAVEDGHEAHWTSEEAEGQVPTVVVAP